MPTQLSSADKIHTAYIQVSPIRDQEGGMYPFTYWLAWAYDYSELDSNSKIYAILPPGAAVLRVANRVDEAFTGATDLTIGDGTDPDGFLATGVASPTAAGDFVCDTDAAYADGKYYEDGDTIDIYIAGPVTAGSGKLFVEVLSYFEDLAEE